MELKQWYETKELIGLPGLPGTRQGINLKAKKEEWKKRKALGVMGRAFEFHIDSLPLVTQDILKNNENTRQYISNNSTSANVDLCMDNKREVEMPEHKIHALLDEISDATKDELYSYMINRGLDRAILSNRDLRLIDLVSDLDDQEFKEIFAYIRKAKYTLLAGYKIEPEKINAEIEAERKKQV